MSIRLWIATIVILVTGGICFYLCPPTLRSSVIGSTVAILIAFVGYPLQKSVDRENKIHDEQRLIVADAIRVAGRSYSSIMLKNKDAAREGKYSALDANVLIELYFPHPELAEKYRSLRAEIRRYYAMRFPDSGEEVEEIRRSPQREAVRRSRREFIKATRKHFGFPVVDDKLDDE